MSGLDLKGLPGQIQGPEEPLDSEPNPAAEQGCCPTVTTHKFRTNGVGERMPDPWPKADVAQVLGIVECPRGPRRCTFPLMPELDADRLADSLASDPEIALVARARVSRPSAPEPYVSPRIDVHASPHDENPFAAEVLIISAPAAVGKSTTARYLAARSGAPLLDLAEVHVSTNTLVGLFASDFGDASAALAAFHAAQLPVVIDALDEGRLRSGDANFEQFLETSWELLLRDRSVTDRPKLVVLGRDVAADLVSMSLELYGQGVTTASLHLDFFNAEDAASVIEAHAEKSARLADRAWAPTVATREAVSAFFSAIASALGLSDEDALWTDAQGRAFSGYAPVLAAIGSLLAAETNPLRLKNALEGTGMHRAWEVIERVAMAILEREQNEKFVPQFEAQATGPVPPEAYDSTEQLNYLVAQALGEPLETADRVRLGGPDAELYRRMVTQHLEEHPFLQEGQLTNEVLASLVVANALAQDRLIDKPRHLDLLRRASRQPFLWRSSQRFLEEDALVLGQHLGPLLNSLWNDLSRAPMIHVESADSEVAAVTLSEPDIRFQVLQPVELYEQATNLQLRLEGDLRLEGSEGARGMASFDLRDDVTIAVGGTLTIAAAAVRLDGSIRIEAGGLLQPGNLQLAPPPTTRTKTWWGGELATAVPWRDLQPELEPIQPPEPVGELERLLDQCRRRIPGGAPLVVFEDFTLADPGKGSWLRHDASGDRLKDVIRQLVYHGFAYAEPFGASGSETKLRVHFRIGWDDLLSAVREPPASADDLAALANDLKSLFDEDASQVRSV